MTRHSMTFWEFRSRVVNKLLETLRNYDDDDKGNVKKSNRLKDQTTTLYVHLAFCTFLCSPCITTT